MRQFLNSSMTMPPLAPNLGLRKHFERGPLNLEESSNGSSLIDAHKQDCMGGRLRNVTLALRASPSNWVAAYFGTRAWQCFFVSTALEGALREEYDCDWTGLYYVYPFRSCLEPSKIHFHMPSTPRSMLLGVLQLARWPIARMSFRSES